MTQLDERALLGLADAYRTPLYVFDARTLAERIDYLRRSLPNMRLCYAMKANPFVLRELIARVDRLEVCSPGEYRICRATGMPNGKIVVSGVYKDRTTIETALMQPEPPAALTVESWSQLELIRQVAGGLAVRVPVLLRLTSGNQFGLSRELVLEAIGELAGNPRIELLGIQYFSGTQKTSSRRFARELGALKRLMDEAEGAFGWTPSELEYGAGLPVAYFDGDELDEGALLEALAQAIAEISFAGSIVLELGRSIAASCGTYLTRVVDTKVNARQRYAITDGGIHHLTYYGQSMAMRRPPCRVLGRETAPDDGGAQDPWALCGALCTVNDLLAKQLSIGELGIGDILAFDRAGAYCMTEGISLFLSRDLPGVVIVDEDGQPRLARAPTPTDPLNTPMP